MQAHADLDSSDDEPGHRGELVVNNVPEEVFDNHYVKEEFKSLFCGYGSHATFSCQEGRQRVFVLYLSTSQCAAAKTALDGVVFEGRKLEVRQLSKLSSECLLKPPRQKKEFLISPPISPPEAEQTSRSVDGVGSQMLQAAIAGLGESGSVFELHGGDAERQLPSIVVSLE